MAQTSSIATILEAERPRLVRLCARLSGSWDAAEDLAQETLLQAWRHLDRLYGLDQVSLWLSGIARNVCLYWSRRHYREQSQLASGANEDSPGSSEPIDSLPDEFDLEVGLERQELIGLLDKALALLPQETRTVLVHKYVHESPYAEIADHLGITENAVAARVHRGKLAFRRVLTSELREEAAIYGLLSSSTLTWQETRIWCPQCGRRRLSGRFVKDAVPATFELQCLGCDDGIVGTQVDLSIPYFAELLGPIKTFKPAFNRLLAAAREYCQQALTTQIFPCLVCGQQTTSWIGQRTDNSPRKSDEYEVRIRCNNCAVELNNSLSSLAMSLPEVQQFWRSHPHPPRP